MEAAEALAQARAEALTARGELDALRESLRVSEMERLAPAPVARDDARVVTRRVRRRIGRVHATGAAARSARGGMEGGRESDGDDEAATPSKSFPSRVVQGFVGVFQRL